MVHVLILLIHSFFLWVYIIQIILCSQLLILLSFGVRLQRRKKKLQDKVLRQVKFSLGEGLLSSFQSLLPCWNFVWLMSYIFVKYFCLYFIINWWALAYDLDLCVLFSFLDVSAYHSPRLFSLIFRSCLTWIFTLNTLWCNM